MRIRNCICIAALAILITGCSREQEPVPSGILPPDSMASELADFHMVEARLVMSATRSLSQEEKSAFVLSMMRKSGMDTSRFNRSFDYYTRNPEQFSKIYELAITEISRRQAEEKN